MAVGAGSFSYPSSRIAPIRRAVSLKHSISSALSPHPAASVRAWARRPRSASYSPSSLTPLPSPLSPSPQPRPQPARLPRNPRRPPTPFVVSRAGVFRRTVSNHPPDEATTRQPARRLSSRGPPRACPEPIEEPALSLSNGGSRLSPLLPQALQKLRAPRPSGTRSLLPSSHYSPLSAHSSPSGGDQDVVTLPLGVFDQVPVIQI